jgi:hypothetical protein
VCSLKTLQAPCIVYSLGSQGDVSFEQDIIKNTPCDVHTFDCTVDSIRIIDPKRHRFHKLCVGRPKGDQAFYPFEQLNSIMRRLGHGKLAMLKMDIEGYEFEVGCCWQWCW